MHEVKVTLFYILSYKKTQNRRPRTLAADPVRTASEAPNPQPTAPARPCPASPRTGRPQRRLTCAHTPFTSVCPSQAHRDDGVFGESPLRWGSGPLCLAQHNRARVDLRPSVRLRRLSARQSASSATDSHAQLDPQAGPKFPKFTRASFDEKTRVAGRAGCPLRYHSSRAGDAHAPCARAMHWSMPCSSALKACAVVAPSG